jgi:hypothetical protein
VAGSASVLPDLNGNLTRHFRPVSTEDLMSYSPWIEDLQPKTNINHPMLPLVYDFGKSIDYSVDYLAAKQLLSRKQGVDTGRKVEQPKSETQEGKKRSRRIVIEDL